MGIGMVIGSARGFTMAALVAAAIGMGSGRASACEPGCGGYGHALPYHAVYDPPVYAPPPPYAYAYAYAPEYPVYAPPPRVQVNYYYSRRVTVVRRPRRVYRTRWHPRACRAGCRRVKVCGRRW